MNAIEELLKRNEELEHELRQHEGLVHLLGIGSHELVWVWDVDIDVLNWYGRHRGILGYDNESMPGTLRDWENLIHEEDRYWYHESVQNSLQTANSHFANYRVRRRDGSWAYFQESGGALRQNGTKTTSMISVIRDMTEQYQLHKKIRDAKQLLYSCVDATSDVLFVLNADDSYRFINQAFAKRAAQHYQEILGTTDANFPQPELIAKIRDMARTVRQTGEETESLEMCDNEIFLVKVFQVSQEQEPGMVGCILRDISPNPAWYRSKMH